MIDTGAELRSGVLRNPFALVGGRVLLVVRTLPVWAWLLSIACCSFATDMVLGAAAKAPVVFSDELIYSQLARRAGDGLAGWIDVARSGYGLVYPLVLAPFWSNLTLPSAYEVTKVLNAVAFTSAVVPAFLLARRLLRPPWALLVAVAAAF